MQNNDAPCDAPETNELVWIKLCSAPLTWLLPRPVRMYAESRLRKGFKEYGAHLRMGWDKASDYAVEEEGDLVNYHLAGGNYVRVVLYGWIAFFGWLWDGRKVNNDFE